VGLLGRWRRPPCHGLAYLVSLNLSGFDPKAPPLKTQAFWDIA
jgi:hypothetical protein